MRPVAEISAIQFGSIAANWRIRVVELDGKSGFLGEFKNSNYLVISVTDSTTAKLFVGTAHRFSLIITHTEYLTTAECLTYLVPLQTSAQSS